MMITIFCCHTYKQKCKQVQNIKKAITMEAAVGSWICNLGFADFIKNLQTSANFYDLRIFHDLGVASFSFIQKMNSLLFMCCKLLGILLYCKQWFCWACPAAAAAAAAGIDLAAVETDLALCACERTQVLHLDHALGKCWEKEILFLPIKFHQTCVGTFGAEQVLVRV